MSSLTAALAAFQTLGALIALRRLSLWRNLPPPLEPAASDDAVVPDVTVVVPTLNEAQRIAPLLAGLAHQRVRQIIIVDSRSTDGTLELLFAAAKQDPRIRLLRDDPLPEGWIGKAWALECARRHVFTRWMLMLDADTAPRAELAQTLVSFAEQNGLDAISLAPRFAGQTAAERWLQPALLASLLMRFAPGGTGASGRVLANGQCFLVRTEALDKAGGFAPVRGSFSEDVSLARHLAANGARVVFRDGVRLYDVRSYASAGAMWREWGRSIDLKDATTPAAQIVDAASMVAVQGMPVITLALAVCPGVHVAGVLTVISAALIALRFALLVPLRHSYAERGVPYWLSPLSDPLAAIRVVLSSLRRPTTWRGRPYPRGARR